ncbi:MAG: hypothetical protein ACK4SZ_15430 [Allosphingosinicella sp.]|uniref:hypothetical protein n=1 Tax=Allosphingosinicella sp. TaxID=2823234 RepID=UPI0039627A9C
MDGIVAVRAPAWFWIVVGVALLWNLLGVTAYLAEAFGMAQSEAHRALVDVRPAWATAAYAVAVFGGSLGCIALLARRRAAFPLLAVSFAALLVQQAWNLAGPDAAIGVEGPALGFAVIVVLVSLGLVLLSRAAIRKGWVR